ncbi:hypothetical protein [Halorussus halophilus]|uniref:hypothetical protein n=1 Tax=Halorussus halophilus TaxID=2650975 RepID=UPI0013019573|nr:hypothetical protein [Halorussus halophilus]
MYDVLSELGAELLAVVAYAIGTVALSGLAAAAEYTSFQQLQLGNTIPGVWSAVIGLVALGFAVKLAREKLLVRITANL